ncbi:bifunctional diaminohydroxyphosphoribosylaminopyrimidine deaminase/5-amino-6-(5-phosphoribosylamino)uracil reductase RibD [Crocosphaera chwakensis]|uniref:Riboflavin biosynthesis protein RibD n=1 Tax=Crocosphaera chwakensis CCY0110 TaxID=391612 RepID=A3IXY3_9CHRO|nr:bifunctional diaminohydroxyphosphoribosylaminopyrimidine deaminase/5-amino-6-(5-phosphoribosylamino)uracil reductase RibD [Crocosphaera chwakensis]EAZ88652.1 riboflavin biosynthesis protein [Crocosphaera chwakensis CCY0110]
MIIPDNVDQQMMQRCLTLARQGLGYTSPNPLVGAVIVKDGKIIGEGFHPKAGEPHAEVFALREAGEKAVGGTVYVNLEPCNHYGRTPPCTEALISAKVARVVVGMVDPNPLVSGKGIARLQEAGIEVTVGVEEAACLRLNEAFCHRILNNQPFGILKYAMTLDGKISSSTGHSAWVTGTKSRQLVHQIRAGCDAVIVGGNTVRRDNPHLTIHQVTGVNPLRVVMSRNLHLPEEANLWNVDIAPTIVFTEWGNNPSLQTKLRDKGVEVIELSPLTPSQVMDILYERQLCSVLWECGGVLGAEAITQRVIQKIMAFIAPKIIGGFSAASPVGDLGLDKMSDALPLQNVSFRQVERDILVEGYLEAI